MDIVHPRIRRRGASEQWPANLIDLEAERDLIACALRAGELAERAGFNGEANLKRVASLDPDDLVYHEHRAILLAIQTVLKATGTLMPLIVRDQLRAHKESDALRLLPYIASPDRGVTAAALGYAAAAVHRVAERRRRFEALRNEAAEVVSGGAS